MTRQSEEGARRPGDGNGSWVQGLAERAGFDLAGVARPDPSEHHSFFREWLRRGFQGEMAYLERSDAVARRGEIRLTMADVRSVVVVAHRYRMEDAPGVPADPSVGVIARYARGRDYHKVVKRRLQRLLALIREEVAPEASGHAYVDTGPILERELAERAGLGWFGKNTMLIHPRRGSWFFLGCLLLDVELGQEASSVTDRCGTCSRCLDACPTGALLGRDDSGAPVIDARRCISYLTIEHRGAIPEDLRPLMGNRVFGCDICQEVCPFNERFAEEAEEPAYAMRGPGERPFGVEALPGEDVLAESAAVVKVGHPGTEAPSLLDLLETALDEEAWDGFSRGSAIRRAGRAGFARNVCVAIGNWGSEETIPVLSLALADAEPLVREHAVWALRKIGTPAALAVLSGAREGEGDASS